MTRKFRQPVCYSSLKKSDKIKPFSTFDTETVGLGGELICITFFTPEMTDKPQMLLASELDKFLDMCEYVGGDFYAHNLSYDLRTFMPRLIARYDSSMNIMLRANKDVFLLEVLDDDEKPIFSFKDSYALFPHSLKSFSEKFAPEYTKFTINDIEHFDITDREHVAYALQDVVSLYYSLKSFKELISESFGCDVTATISSTAVKAWRTTIPKEYKYFMTGHKASLSMIRDAYYGGLTGLTSTETFYNTRTYDINSSYPAVMESIGVPYGGNMYSTHVSEKHISKIGFIHVKVKTPDDLVVPILPTRDSHGNLIWRTGEFYTTVTTPELLFAMRHGYEILEYVSGVFFEEMIKPFSEFVSSCREIRHNNKGEPLEQVAKLMQNSLYGKFGMKDEGIEAVIFDPNSDEVIDLEGLFPTMLEGLYFKVVQRKSLSMPQWAAWITAMARLRLLKVIYEIGVDKVIYYDTDSITVTEDCEFPEKYLDASEYGKFKLEKTAKKFRAIAPKVYAIVLDDETKVVKAKGIPTKNIQDPNHNKYLEFIELHKAIMSNNTDHSMEFTTLSSFPVYMKTGKNLYNTRRKLTDIRNSSNWASKNGKVTPKYEKLDNRKDNSDSDS